MESLYDALPEFDPSFLAAWAEHQQRARGNNDGGGGQIEPVKYDTNVTITEHYHDNGVVSGGCECHIQAPSGMLLADFTFTVSEPGKDGTQLLLYSHERFDAFKNPGNTTSSYFAPNRRDDLGAMELWPEWMILIERRSKTVMAMCLP